MKDLADGVDASLEEVGDAASAEVDGAFMVFRGGWTDKTASTSNTIGFTMHVLERGVGHADPNQVTYSLVTCNTTMDGSHNDPEDKFIGGLGYHPAVSDEYPKVKARTCITVDADGRLAFDATLRVKL